MSESEQHCSVKENTEIRRSYKRAAKKEDRHLWLPSYFVESIGASNEQAVAKLPPLIPVRHVQTAAQSTDGSGITHTGG